MHLFFTNYSLAYLGVLVFDRMFSLGVRAESVSINGRVTAATVAGAATGPRRHFLYCTLKPDPGHKSKKSREAP